MYRKRNNTKSKRKISVNGFCLLNLTWMFYLMTIDIVRPWSHQLTLWSVESGVAVPWCVCVCVERERERDRVVLHHWWRGWSASLVVMLVVSLLVKLVVLDVGKEYPLVRNMMPTLYMHMMCPSCTYILCAKCIMPHICVWLNVHNVHVICALWMCI
jgi:hypothetical protein